MNMIDIIAHKRDKLTLTNEEIQYFVKGVTDGSIPDYQTSALLMAIVLNGMNHEETVSLTKYMTASGNQLDLSCFGNKTVDKHSTGGVGDKTTLIIAPIVASLGGIIAKMSGKGLGHTGGTIDKLDSIPNFQTTISTEDFLKQVQSIGLAVVGQTENLAPADKKLYALRDITATVACIPLIASSIMSKKLAAGNHSILLDVKVGSGAFMKTEEEAKALAKQMVEIGKSCHKNMAALITNMEAPLGNAIGNQLEVLEAIEILKNGGPTDLRDLCIELSSHMLFLCHGESIEVWKEKVKEVLQNGLAFQKFQEMVCAQKGDLKAFFNEPKAKNQIKVLAKQSGYLYKMDAETVGMTAMLLGAGRQKLTDTIDYQSGILLNKKPGDQLCKGELLATLYTNKDDSNDEIVQTFYQAITISEQKPTLKPLLIDTIL